MTKRMSPEERRVRAACRRYESLLAIVAEREAEIGQLRAELVEAWRAARYPSGGDGRRS